MALRLTSFSFFETDKHSLLLIFTCKGTLCFSHGRYGTVSCVLTSEGLARPYIRNNNVENNDD